MNNLGSYAEALDARRARYRDDRRGFGLLQVRHGRLDRARGAEHVDLERGPPGILVRCSGS